MPPPTASVEPAVELLPSPQNVGAALSRLALGMRGLLWHEARLAGYSASQAQTLLALLDSPRPMTTSRLAEQFGTTAQTVSEIIGTLERKGLVERTFSQADRRQVDVHLTAEGRSEAGRLLNWHVPLAGGLQELSAAEQGLFYRTLVTLLARLESLGMVGARVCPSCEYYSPCTDGAGVHLHQCSLTKLRMSDCELRIDCPDYLTAHS